MVAGNVNPVLKKCLWRLQQFEETPYGKFCRYENGKDGLHVFLIVDFVIPNTSLKVVKGIKVGENIAILRTDNDANPVRVRRL